MTESSAAGVLEVVTVAVVEPEVLLLLLPLNASKALALMVVSITSVKNFCFCGRLSQSSISLSLPH